MESQNAAATRGSGIPLCLDEIRSGLAACRLGKRLHYFAAIDSTNVLAHKLAQEGAAEGEIVIAEEQSQGKGRMGRAWVSPPYVNLYLSIILRPRLLAVDAPQLTLMAAVALAEAIQSFISSPVEIKWPNDILVHGRKLAGILTESSSERDRIAFVILGMGVNLNYPRELMPETLRQKATSVMTLNQRPVDRPLFTQRLIQHLDRCYGELENLGFSALASRWEGFFHLRGKRVEVKMLQESVFGRAVGIDRDGALLLEDDERKTLRRIVAGDVIPVDV